MKPTKLMSVALGFVLISLIACSGPSFAVSVGYNWHHTVDSPMPRFENRFETDHFVLHWTNRSAHYRDNIADSQVIRDTAGYLETAWNKYVTLFGRTPYVRSGQDKMDVVFRDIDCYGVADPPEGPIQFSARDWMDKPGIRQPTSAHELFHKLQYAYGYKTQWNPRKPYLWFTEGTAAWAEVFVWGRVSRTCKVDEIFKDVHLDLYQADDMAMPFWIYFVSGNRAEPNHHLMVKLLEKCEQMQDEKLALAEVVRETYGPADHFFASFARERKDGFWSETCSAPYKCILGPDGQDVVNRVRNLHKGKF